MRFGGPIPAETLTVPAGTAGVRATLKLMVGLVQRYKLHPLIRETARSLVQGCADRDQLCEVGALQAYVRDQIRYTADVSDVETLQTPVVTLGYQEPGFGQYAEGGTASGDCDDKSTLLAALMAAVSIPGAFCAVKVAGQSDYSHVLVVARLRQRTQVANVPLETIVPGVEPGWYPPDTTCFMLAHFA